MYLFDIFYPQIIKEGGVIMAKKTVNGVTLEVPEFKCEKAEVKIGTILRLVFLIAAYINQVCDVLGAYDMIIPVEYQSVVSLVSLIATAAASVSAYWFNNSWTAEATTADKILVTMKYAATYCPEIITATNKTVLDLDIENKTVRERVVEATPVPETDTINNDN